MTSNGFPPCNRHSPQDSSHTRQVESDMAPKMSGYGVNATEDNCEYHKGFVIKRLTEDVEQTAHHSHRETLVFGFDAPECDDCVTGSGHRRYHTSHTQ